MHGRSPVAEAPEPESTRMVRMAKAKHTLLVFGALALGMTSSASAQVQTVERSAKGQSAKDIRLGVYINVQPDCTSGALPVIRLLTPPAHGKVTVKKGKVNATNFKQCLALEVPGYVAFYRSLPNFAGTDKLTMEVKYPGGRTEVQNVTVSVAGTGLEQRI